MANTTLVQQGKDIKAFLGRADIEQQFREALPKQLDPKSFIRVCITTIMQNPKLLACRTDTLLKALIQAAIVGLQPDGIHAYLIPYGNEVVYQTDYKGLVKLARQSGEIVDIKACVIYEKDEFSYEHGTNQFLRHVKVLGKDRGKPIGVYSLADFKDGKQSFIVLTEEEVMLAKQSSKSASSGSSPWKTHPDAMWGKTAIRQHAKTLPQAKELHRAAIQDERFDMNLGALVSPMGGKTAAKTEELAGKLGGKNKKVSPEASEKLRKALIQEIEGRKTESALDEFWGNNGPAIDDLSEDDYMVVHSVYDMAKEEFKVAKAKAVGDEAKDK